MAPPATRDDQVFCFHAQLCALAGTVPSLHCYRWISQHSRGLWYRRRLLPRNRVVKRRSHEAVSSQKSERPSVTVTRRVTAKKLCA